MKNVICCVIVELEHTHHTVSDNDASYVASLFMTTIINWSFGLDSKYFLL